MICTTSKTVLCKFHRFKCCECGHFKNDNEGQLWDVCQPGTYEFICFECENRIYLEAEGDAF